MDLRLALVGCGNVGRAFIALVAAKEAELRERYDLRLRFTGGATRTAGGWIADEGIAAAELAALTWPGAAWQPDAAPGSRAFEGDGLAFIAACPTDIVIELTTLNPLTGEPALSHIRAALEAGRHVVTANKGPIAHAYRELRELAQARGVQLRFESTVMDGTPIFNLAEFSLPATSITGVRGPLNSTSNYVLGEMARGATLEEALAGAQRGGFAEANPNYDLEGWDAAVKVTVLANVLMDAGLRPDEVAREGLGADAMRAAHAALAPGETLKQMAQARRGEDGRIAATVALVALPPRDVFAQLVPGETALRLEADTMGELTLIEGAGGPEQTAFGVLADVIAIARAIGA
jgi:homoserine dehydrogenase